MSRVRHTGPRVALVLAVLGCLVIYLPGLHGPMLLDDFPQLGPILGLGGDWSGLVQYLDSSSGLWGRPVSMATFIANAGIGGESLWQWKAVNLAIHLCNGLLIYFLLRRILGLAVAGAAVRQSTWLAAAGTALWLLHPLQVSTVLYIVQRMTQLSAMFLLGALLLYLVGRTERGWGRLQRGLCIGVAVGILFPLACLSKENGFLFPFFVALIEIVMISGGRQGGVRSIPARALGIACGVMMVMIALYVVPRLDLIIFSGYQVRDFTLWERLLTQARALVFYQYQFLWPVPGNLGFFHDDFAISRGLLNPVTTSLSGLLLLVQLGGAWAVRRRAPLVSLGMFWFFVAHLMESTVIPLEPVFEHRNYLALLGLVIAVLGVLERIRIPDQALLALFAIVVIACGWLTAERTATWRSAGTLYTHILATHPRSPRINLMVADELMRAGRHGEADALLAKFDDSGTRVVRLYIDCLGNGAIADAEAEQVRASVQGPVTSHLVSGLLEVGRAGLEGRCSFRTDWYIDLVMEVLALPTRPVEAQKLLMYVAHYRNRQGDTAAAIATLREAYDAIPGHPVPLFLAVEWLLDAGQIVEARTMFRRAREVAEASPRDFSHFVSGIEERLAAAVAAPDSHQGESN